MIDLINYNSVSVVTEGVLPTGLHNLVYMFARKNIFFYKILFKTANEYWPNNCLIFLWK